MTSEIHITDQDIESITITIGNIIKYTIGAIGTISCKNDFLDETFDVSRVGFIDKIYDNFDVEIKYKSGKLVILKDFNIVKKNRAFCYDRYYIFAYAVISKNIAKEEEDHSGQIYNAYTNKWSWL